MLENKYEKCFERIRGFEVVNENHIKSYDKKEEVILPLRGSKYSAGYDFFAPYRMIINPGETEMFWTDVKAYMQEYEYLSLHIRSSIGIKKGLVLSNITGIIDMDYFGNPSNDGNIGASLRNVGNNPVVLEKSERFMQGIFMCFLGADNCNSEKDRKGGIGSTNE
jgi:dUTP pyrophosphatase